MACTHAYSRTYFNIPGRSRQSSGVMMTKGKEIEGNPSEVRRLFVGTLAAEYICCKLTPFGVYTCGSFLSEVPFSNRNLFEFPIFKHNVSLLSAGES